jgi:hypothetical protein
MFTLRINFGVLLLVWLAVATAVTFIALGHALLGGQYLY